MDAVELLTEEHKKVKGLFASIEGSDDDATRQRLLGEAIADLKSHTKIEEQVLYPVMRQRLTGGSKLFEEAMQEHQEAKKAIRKLEGMSLGDEEWQPTFEILMHGVLHHATEEEAEMFPKLRETLSEQILVELGEQMTAAKAGETAVDLSKEELLEQAKASDIEGRSGMDKPELERALGHR